LQLAASALTERVDEIEDCVRRIAREIHMSGLYDDGHRELQDHFDSRRLADRLEQRLTKPVIDDETRRFIEERDMFFIASVDSQGMPTCSYKGGDPGFVRVVDERTLEFPSYDGNGMFLSLGNLRTSAKVGLLFIDFENPKRVRVQGEASVSLEGAPADAQCLVRIGVTHVFPNCSRYIHQLRLVERSRFVPRGAEPPPVPQWKQSEWARDVLPKK
jgi:predicted pyridoxine 5'-phosphate oxidase superfamily flavin-nucleotide-binding protein